MELTVSDEKIKEFLRETLIEMMRENKEEFRDLVMEAIEDIGPANAIKEGRKNKFVSEDRIRRVLES